METSGLEVRVMTMYAFIMSYWADLFRMLCFVCVTTFINSPLYLKTSHFVICCNFVMLASICITFGK